MSDLKIKGMGNFSVRQISNGWEILANVPDSNGAFSGQTVNVYTDATLRNTAIDALVTAIKANDTGS